LLVVGIFTFIILRPEYFNPFKNIRLYFNVPMQAAVMGVMTIGVAGTILLGDIDLSVVGVMAVSSAVGVLLFKSGVPAPLAMLIIIAIGALFALSTAFDRKAQNRGADRDLAMTLPSRASCWRSPRGGPSRWRKRPTPGLARENFSASHTS
jgi:hypothetical protein